MNTCARGGYLVDGAKPLPTDPTEFHVDGLPIIGCNRLRCARCGAEVRHAIGLDFTRDVSDAEIAAVHGGSDLATSPLLRRAGDPEARVYLCRCHRRLETSVHSCDELGSGVPFLYDDDSSRPEPTLPWRCHGHASISLPHDLDGVVVSSQAELRDLALRARDGDFPPRARPEDKSGAAWLARLFARLGPADAAVVASVARDRLVRATPQTSAVAPRFRPERANEPPTPAKHDDDAALDDPRLALALDSPDYCETFARSEEPLGAFLRALGAYRHELRDWKDYTDWNGAVVGGEPGDLLRAAIPPSGVLSSSEIARLLAMGRRARALVAEHPSTPDDVLAQLAEDADSEVRGAAQEQRARKAQRAKHPEALDALDRLEALAQRPPEPAKKVIPQPARAPSSPAPRCPKCGSVSLEAGHVYTCYDCGAEFAPIDAMPQQPLPAAPPLPQVAGRALPCPRCEIALHEARAGDVTLYGCGRCGGVWLDDEATRKLFRVDVLELVARADRVQPPKDDARTVRRCPIDRRPLMRESVRGVDVDTCKLHGSFFDVGEVRRIAAALQRDGASPTADAVVVFGGIYRSMAKPSE